MWSSLKVGVGENFVDLGDELGNMVASTLSHHPLVKQDPSTAVIIAKEALPRVEESSDIFVEMHEFPANGDSWFVSHFGKDAEEVVKNFKRLVGT